MRWQRAPESHDHCPNAHTTDRRRRRRRMKRNGRPLTTLRVPPYYWVLTTLLVPPYWVLTTLLVPPYYWVVSVVLAAPARVVLIESDPPHARVVVAPVLPRGEQPSVTRLSARRTGRARSGPAPRGKWDVTLSGTTLSGTPC